MMHSSFKPALDAVREATGHGIRVPSHGLNWSASQISGKVSSLKVEVDASLLSKNMQTNSASWVSFLLCLSYFLERAQGTPVQCIAEIQGKLEAEPRGHDWRSIFVLSELQRLLPKRLTITPAMPDIWKGIPDPFINSPSKGRHHCKPKKPWQDLFMRYKRLTEKILESQITQSPALLIQSLNNFEPPTDICAQYPVGLFDGKVSNKKVNGDFKHRITPGGTSEIDLWGYSTEKKTLHLFELKKPGNQLVGILTESFYYTMLLKALKDRGTQCDKPDWPGYKALMDSERIITWLTAENFHPLISNRGASPLSWLNDSLKQEGVEFRLLRYELDTPENQIKTFKVV